MKRALSAIAGVGILALIVGVGTANAQSYRRYCPARAYTPQGYTPQSRDRFAARAVCAPLRFPTRTVQKPPAAAASVATKEEPTAPGMPSFAWQINDEQVAAVATYVRNRWGHPAPAVSSSDVAKLRSRLTNRAE